MISILLTVGKNSKFFAKFMAAYVLHTTNPMNVELLVMANSEDTWNNDFFELYHDKIKLFYEDSHIGKNGRHVFYTSLAELAEGDWLWHMCDDHYLLKGYDEYMTGFLSGLDSTQPHIVVPRVENSGSISHILSRGWFEKVGRMGAHGNIDSYLNRLSERVLDDKIIHHPGDPVLVDFTVDPTIMTPEHTKIEIDTSFPVYGIDSEEIKKELEIDASKLNENINTR